MRRKRCGLALSTATPFHTKSHQTTPHHTTSHHTTPHHTTSYHTTQNIISISPVYACCMNRCFLDPMISLKVHLDSEKHSVSVEAM